MRQPMQINN